MLVIAIGLVIGAVLGLTGAGGSVFAVPLLILGLGLSANEAMGLSLAAVSASALWGGVHRIYKREVAWLPALALIISGVILAPVGRWLAQDVDPFWLMAGFSVLVIIVAWRMWQQAVSAPETASEFRASRSDEESEAPVLCRLNAWQQFELRPRCLLGVLAAGSVAGLLSGFFGVGGGFVIVPMLVLLTGLSMRQAVATSLVIIAFISASGFASFLMLSPSLPLALLAYLVGGGILGMMLGSYFGRRIAGPKLQKMFAVAMVLLVMVMLFVL